VASISRCAAGCQATASRKAGCKGSGKLTARPSGVVAARVKRSRRGGNTLLTLSFGILLTLRPLRHPVNGRSYHREC